MDSGEYETMATAVLNAWKYRHSTGDIPDHPVLFMHSNLGSYEEVADVMKLPRHIRPFFLCFGTLADGFLPFEWEENKQKEEEDREAEEEKDFEELRETVQSAEKLRQELGLVPKQEQKKKKQVVEIPIPPPISNQVQLASVVMKVVQAKHPAFEISNLETMRMQMPCAAKLGDDYDSLVSSSSSSSSSSVLSAAEHNKLQLDPRLSAEEKLRVVQQLKEAASVGAAVLDTEMAGADGLENFAKTHSEDISAYLAAAYHAITREGLFS